MRFKYRARRIDELLFQRFVALDLCHQLRQLPSGLVTSRYFPSVVRLRLP
jgi:hypothetical protein